MSDRLDKFIFNGKQEDIFIFLDKYNDANSRNVRIDILSAAYNNTPVLLPAIVTALANGTPLSPAETALMIDNRTIIKDMELAARVAMGNFKQMIGPIVAGNLSSIFTDDTLTIRAKLVAAIAKLKVTYGSPPPHIIEGLYSTMSAAQIASNATECIAMISTMQGQLAVTKRFPAHQQEARGVTIGRILNKLADVPFFPTKHKIDADLKASYLPNAAMYSVEDAFDYVLSHCQFMQQTPAPVATSSYAPTTQSALPPGLTQAAYVSRQDVEDAFQRGFASGERQATKRAREDNQSTRNDWQPKNNNWQQRNQDQHQQQASRRDNNNSARDNSNSGNGNGGHGNMRGGNNGNPQHNKSTGQDQSSKIRGQNNQNSKRAYLATQKQSSEDNGNDNSSGNRGQNFESAYSAQQQSSEDDGNDESGYYDNDNDQDRQDDERS